MGCKSIVSNQNKICKSDGPRPDCIFENNATQCKRPLPALFSGFSLSGSAVSGPTTADLLAQGINLTTLGSSTTPDPAAATALVGMSV
jgi:hypothetical protein